MPDPLFDNRTSRFELPLLFAGQSQKEFYVNEALGRLDALMHLVLEGERADPPAAPLDGQAWRVAAGASGEWTGQTGKVAARQAGAWLFMTPQAGLRAFDKSAGCEIRYDGGWLAATRPVLPSGGEVVDSQARQVLTQIVAALTSAGIVPPT